MQLFDRFTLCLDKVVLLGELTPGMFKRDDNNRSWSDLKDIAWWDRPPRTRPVPAARPPRPARPRIYSRRTRRCRLPGIVRTGCFSPWGAASVNHASPGMRGNGTDAQPRGCECVSAESRGHGAPLLRSSVRKVRLLPLPQRQHLLHTFLQSTKIPTGAETELHTMVTRSYGVSVSCDATREFCSLYIKIQN